MGTLFLSACFVLMPMLAEAADLPWNRLADQAPKPPMRRLSSAREMLELFGIDDSQIRQLVDGRPLHSDESETLVKVLYRMPQFGRDRVEAWEKTGVDWAQLAADPDAHRVQVFRLDGRATHVHRVDLPRETASRFEFDHYFQLDLRMTAASYPVRVCCRTIPAAWPREQAIDQRCRCRGLFLKVGDRSGDRPELVFAADRIAWLPDREAPDKGIGPSHVLLGDLGMDVGLFDQVRGTNRKGLLPEDRECFYQLLAAVGRADPADLFRRAEGPFALEPMLNRPETQHGRLIIVTGTARRVQRVLVDDADVQQRFGIDHYYQVDVLVPLGDQEVRLGSGRRDEQTPVFTVSYPVTCCVLRLPEGLREAEDVRQEVQIAGFYFKLWAFKSDYVAGFDPQQRQPGPMFIATTPRLVKRVRATNPIWGWMAGLSFLVALLVVIVVLWRYHRSAEQFERALRKQRLERGQGESLDEMGIESQDEPDFGGLP